VAELCGLTWDHPRGYGPLEALGGAVRWSRQSLEGFESTPIAGLAAQYDLLVIAHPALGNAVAAGALLPVDALLGRAELARWRAGTVGACFDSYAWRDRQWAVPIDAATQVAVAAGGVDPPVTWAEVARLARTGDVTLCLGGPHALLTYWSICLAHGGTPPAVPRDTALQALEIMAEVLAHAGSELWRRGPAGLLAAMATGAARYCPLVYGYAAYDRKLTFVDAPAGPHGRGSVLGGTGLAVSRRRAGDPAVLQLLAEEVRRCISGPAQETVFPAAGGQPATRQVWETTAGFYAGTRATVETAWVRPRDPGYLAFQTAASAVLREGLAARAVPARLLAGLDIEHERWRSVARPVNRPAPSRPAAPPPA
jgi:multiple sugar transport system substrate-binding protein